MPHSFRSVAATRVAMTMSILFHCRGCRVAGVAGVGFRSQGGVWGSGSSASGQGSPAFASDNTSWMARTVGFRS